ncbi:MAG: trpR [Gammaproteobacteria bacterium]|nr:trpR [Gammaproteobacteria bacterium]
MSTERFKEVIHFCAQETDVKRLSQFFEVFLTQKERESISTRLCIVRALLEGNLSQREIAKKFGLSIAKITRGSNELKRLSSKEREQLKTLLCVTTK